MINLSQTYINIKSTESSKISGGRKFVAAVLMVASIATTSLQAGFVLNASASSNPISAPITSPVVSPAPTPPSAPITSPAVPSAPPAPITSPVVVPSTPPAPSTAPAPITSPVVTPTPVPSPYVKITYPNGGEIFNVGDFVRVAWEQRNVDQCVVSYVNDSNVYGSHFFPINSINNYFNWIVDVSGLAQGSSAQIKMDISCYNAFSNGAFDRSDNYFTVNRPYLSVAPSATPSAAPSAQPSSTPIASAFPIASASPSVAPSSTPIASPSAEPTIDPAPTSAPSNNGGSASNNNGGGSSNSGSSSAPSCNNEAPKVPYLVSAVTSGKNEITLNWSKVAGNVTHYSIAYGVAKNKPMYGAANVGNVTSFKVNGLSGGGTYFFTVKAVNDCTPSVASNKVGVKVGGKFISTPAQGFKPGVLGKKTEIKAQISKPAIVAPVVNQVYPQNNAGLAGKIASFFKGLFN